MIATSSPWLWYTTRASGVVALLLLTASVVLGIVTSLRVATEGWPRFALQDLHKRFALLSTAFIALHVVTAVSDTFAPIGWISVVVPFTSSYRRVWLGLGTIAVDLLIAIVVSSLLRHKIPSRTWRSLHWLTYACWPIALVHGLGTGTDPHLGWMLTVAIACVVAILAALGWRLAAGAGRPPVRLAAGTATVAVVAFVGSWTMTGPLRSGWALRAGTPAPLLAPHSTAGGSTPPAGTAPAGSPASSSTPASPGSSGTAPTAGSATLPSPPYDAAVTGTVADSSEALGMIHVEIRGHTQGSLDAVIDAVIIGSASPEGGVEMSSSSVSFGPPSSPQMYTGTITGLEGTAMRLSLRDQFGNPLELQLDVTISGSDVTGRLATIAGVPGTSGGGSEGEGRTPANGNGGSGGDS